MKIAVTGTTGQVVTSLIERGAAAGHEVIAIGRPDIDLADPASVVRALEATAPDVIVSAAAYTAVDKAESERDLAFAVNGAGPSAGAQAARALGVPLIHISTDYVFDGTLDRPYVQSDPTSALAIADGILQMATNMVADSSPALRGVFHMTAPGEAAGQIRAGDLRGVRGARWPVGIGPEYRHGRLSHACDPARQFAARLQPHCARSRRGAARMASVDLG